LPANALSGIRLAVDRQKCGIKSCIGHWVGLAQRYLLSLPGGAVPRRLVKRDDFASEYDGSKRGARQAKSQQNARSPSVASLDHC
jgi:hypothetical protein